MKNLKRCLISSFILFFAILFAGGCQKTSTPAIGSPKTDVDEQNNESRILKSLDKKGNHLGDWLAFYQAQAAESAGQTESALEKYKSIPASSPASLEADLGLIRLDKSLGAEQIGEKLAKLETRINRSGREDLRSELTLLRAKYAEAQNPLLALSLYAKVREQYPLSKSGDKAKTEFYRLRAGVSSTAETSAAEYLEEAKRLILEQDYSAAAKNISNLRAMLASDSKALYDAQLVEAQIARANTNPQEEKRLLLQVAHCDLPAIKGEALYKLAKNAWNKDENDEALKYINTLLDDVPAKVSLGEILMMKAAIYEQKGESNEAQAIYLSLLDKHVDTLSLIQAARKLAWLYLSNSNYKQAARYFSLAAIKAYETLAQQLAGNVDNNSAPNTGGNLADKKISVSDLRYEYEHNIYWWNQALGNSGDIQEAKEHMDRIIEKNYYSYYAAITASSKGKPVTNPTCAFEPSVDFQERIKTLNTGILNPDLDQADREFLAKLLQQEIDWAFPVKDLSENSTRIAIANDDDLLSVLMRLKYYQASSNYKRQINLARRAINNAYTLDAQCFAQLSLYLYPRPEELIKIAQTESDKVGLSPALALAVIHTESHFDPTARSAVGALGLMQLLPATARDLGLKSEDELFDEQKNISYGVLYLKSLLEQFNNETLAVAAYNAGPSAVNKWLTRFSLDDNKRFIEMIPFGETRNYVKKVIAAKKAYGEQQ
ncbi:MAG: transglycosylase SLT domain-containing protein [Deltaproteobacteria bacterium]|nr:transglycosylase SLT domain-containing protein [Deltaproteobacteria bacterium]